MPYRIAMELALTGSIIPAERLLQFGLINHVVADGTALEAAKILAISIIENAPLGVAASKQVVAQSWDWPAETMHHLQHEIVGRVAKSQDAREGAAAFAEKRKPVWLGL